MSDTMLVTGGNRGIGFALAEALLARGHQVIATFRDSSRVPAAWQAGLPGLALWRLDVTSDASAELLAARVQQEYGVLDVLVNNAGIFVDRDNTGLANLRLADLVTTFETNAVGAARVTQSLLPCLRRSARPRIVNLSSGAGIIATKRTSKYYAYSISKAALNMLTRMMEVELAEYDMAVAAVSPGRVRTAMGDADAPLTPEECAGDLAEMIEHLERGGHFLDRFGKPCFAGGFRDAAGRLWTGGW